MSVTTSVYQSWLADRGIDSPGSQPFVLLGAGIDARSHVVILATASSVGQDIKAQVMKLAAALSTEDSAVSWVVVDESQSIPLIQELRTMMPRLSRVVSLAGSDQDLSGIPFEIERLNFASREIAVMRAPTLEAMNSNPVLKRSFWDAVRSWLF